MKKNNSTSTVEINMKDLLLEILDKKIKILFLAVIISSAPLAIVYFQKNPIIFETSVVVQDGYHLQNFQESLAPVKTFISDISKRQFVYLYDKNVNDEDIEMTITPLSTRGYHNVTLTSSNKISNERMIQKIISKETKQNLETFSNIKKKYKKKIEQVKQKINLWKAYLNALNNFSKDEISQEFKWYALYSTEDEILDLDFELKIAEAKLLGIKNSIQDFSTKTISGIKTKEVKTNKISKYILIVFLSLLISLGYYSTVYLIKEN